MNATAQVWIEGLAAALLLFLALQQPKLASLRWWLCGSCLGLLAELLQSWTHAPGAAGSIVVLCLCAQLGCFSCGFLSHSLRFRQLRLVLPAFLLPGLVLWLLSYGSAERLAASISLIAAAILAMLVFFLSRERRSSAIPLVAGVLGVGMLRELLNIAVALHVMAAAQLQPLLAATAFLFPAVSMFALLPAAFQHGSRFVRQLQEDTDELRLLIDTTDHGICRIDCGGLITFANGPAAEMLELHDEGASGEKPAETWIQEKFRAQDDEGSIRAVADFVLRPTAPTKRATALIPSPNRPPISVEWSCIPVLRDERVVSAIVTLRDITEGDATAKFVRFRTELLEMIARNKPVEEVIRMLVTVIEQRLPGYCCSVLLVDGDFFQVFTSTRTPEGFRSALRSVRCNRILQTIDGKGSMELKNWEDTLRVLARIHGYAVTRSEAMVSIANELLGTVVLNHPVITSPGPAEIRILHEAARLGALAFEHHNSYQRLMHQGYHDPLTGLPNRLLLADRLKQALARADRNQMQVAYISIDLDHFKDINDNLGHDAGDLFLRLISARLATSIRATDTLARNGGDEFTLLLTDLQDSRDAGRVAEALTSSLSEPFEIDNHTLYGSASIGVAMYPGDGADAATLQRNADRAMYRAKSQGRNLVRFYSGEESGDDINRMEIELYLHRAIEQKSFSLCFQPQYTCDGHLDGLEALLRFQHPKLGMVPPSRFIPMAEENGLILPIGEWVLQEVCRQLREWEDKGLRAIRVAINVSPLQLARGDFARTVTEALRRFAVKPETLELELTEGVLMSSVPDSARQISRLAKLGVRLSVDDFGTGYSCLSYLHQLPLHTVKIDRSFICRMLDPDGTRCIVEAIVNLARNLGLQTVAEGVETQEQLTLLRAVGCDLIQGYLFSKPLSSLDTGALLWKNTVSPVPVAIPEKIAPHRQNRPLWMRLSGGND